MVMKIHGDSSDFRVQKVLIACEYAGMKVEAVGKSGHAALIKAHGETVATLPLLEAANGNVLPQSNAICRYVAKINHNVGIYGNGAYEMALVDQWLDACYNEIEIPMLASVSNSSDNNSATATRGKTDLTKFLTILNTVLESKVYIVGDKVTIADIAIACALNLNPEAYSQFKNIERYISTIVNQPNVSKFLKPDDESSSILKTISKAGANKSSMVESQITEKYDRHRLRVKELLRAGLSVVDSTVTIKGWAKTIRVAGAGAFAFLEINDGSCFSGFQCVISKEETDGFDAAVNAGGVGASFAVTGKVVKSPAKGQLIEMKATSVVVYGTVEDPATYPMSKKRHTLEHLRTHAHLRPRSNIHGAAMRVRNAMAFALHKFFNERGFLYIHTPLITASDCEGAGEMFGVTTLLDGKELPKTADGKSVDFTKDFFDKPAFLTVSGQLNVETHCCALSDCYTFGPTFRAENSNTTRHLAEFWMLEPEIAFADLNDDINLAEDMLKYCAKYALDNCTDDITFFDKNVENGLISRLKNVIETDFVRLSYTDAVELLLKPKNLKKGKFEVKPEWGIDLGSEHERFITEVVYKKPVCIYNYPKDIKAFYMRLNDDNKTVAAVDVLVPKIGEIIGGSQREERLDVLNKRIVEGTGHDPADYAWYTDLRKYGSIPHAGFGLGFERLIRFVTGIENIRDVIPFPRWPGNADF